MADHRSDDSTEPRTPPMATGPATTTSATRTAGDVEHGASSYRAGLDTTAGAPVGRQRVNWGPVWAGFVVALAIYIMLEMLLFAVGAREIEVDAAINEGAVVTALVALVALFLGGLTAGATMKWTHPVEGAIHGLLVWALTIVAFIVLSVLGAGLALGGVGTAAGQLGLDIEELAEEAGEEFDGAQVADDARDAAGVAVVALALTLVAAAGGAAVGSRIGAERRAARIDLREGPGYASKVG